MCSKIIFHAHGRFYDFKKGGLLLRNQIDYFLTDDPRHNGVDHKYASSPPLSRLDIIFDLGMV
jgi:hypothetical protein